MKSTYPAAPVSTQTIRRYNLHEALISYCFLGSKADPIIRQKILDGLKTDCDRLTHAADSRGYGNVLEEVNWKERHTIGNSLQMAWELAMASELLGRPDYRQVALNQLHFALGRKLSRREQIPSDVRCSAHGLSRGPPRPENSPPANWPQPPSRSAPPTNVARIRPMLFLGICSKSASSLEISPAGCFPKISSTESPRSRLGSATPTRSPATLDLRPFEASSP